MKLLNKYVNGNYTVTIYDDGTKEREFSENPEPIWPESMDLKCTDYCDAGCGFCHEKSTTDGLHGDLSVGMSLLSDLPAGSEIAIGGGNPLSWSHLGEFVNYLSKRGVICNMTVNSIHVRKETDRIIGMVENKEIYGVGISYFKNLLNDALPIVEKTNNVIFHLIMGVHTVDDLKYIISKVKNPKVLLLGYKRYGRGAGFYSETIANNLYQWYVQIHEFFKKDGLTISFDNLGIKQMNLNRFFTREMWGKFYMGDDGKFTMYVDLVKKQYAMSSTSDKRFDIKADDNTQKIFKKIRENND